MTTNKLTDSQILTIGRRYNGNSTHDNMIRQLCQIALGLCQPVAGLSVQKNSQMEWAMGRLAEVHALLLEDSSRATPLYDVK